MTVFDVKIPIIDIHNIPDIFVKLIEEKYLQN